MCQNLRKKFFLGLLLKISETFYRGQDRWPFSPCAYVSSLSQCQDISSWSVTMMYIRRPVYTGRPSGPQPGHGPKQSPVCTTRSSRSRPERYKGLRRLLPAHGGGLWAGHRGAQHQVTVHKKRLLEAQKKKLKMEIIGLSHSSWQKNTTDFKLTLFIKKKIVV